jgi:hypothetical protein
MASKQLSIIIVLITASVLLNKTIAQNKSVEKILENVSGDYFGQKPPGLKPEIFAPGIISTELFEHGTPVFAKDNSEFYITRVVEPPPRFVNIHYKMDRNGFWHYDTIKFNEKYFNAEVFPSRDEKRLYYTSLQPAPDQKDSTQKIWNIWYVDNIEGKFSESKFLPYPFHTDYHECQLFEASDSSFYFASWRNKGKPDILRIFINEGKYILDTASTKNINTEFYERSPFVSEDGKYLLFQSNRAEGFGDDDIYISIKNKNGTWGKPQNLGDKINTKFREWYPRISPDGKYLFFASDRSGNFEVYWVDADVLRNIFL